VFSWTGNEEQYLNVNVLKVGAGLFLFKGGEEK